MLREKKDQKSKMKGGRNKNMKTKTVCIVGLGYVGLPLAEAFSKHLEVIGFDVDKVKISKLNDEITTNITRIYF